MLQKTPVLKFREGLDAERKCLLHASAHFLASRVVVGEYGKWRRTEMFLLSFVRDRLSDYIDVGERLWVDYIHVYRWTDRASY